MKPITILLLLLSSNMLFAQNSGAPSVVSFSTARRYADPSSRAYNPAKAVEIFKQGAEQGDASAMNALAMLYTKGIGVEENLATALEWYEKAAAKNYAAALYNAGLMYKHGYGRAQDFKKAYEYYSKSAALGHAGGIYGQGYMLYKGFGCKQDYEKAFALFRKGAPMGSTGSMYMLGLCYRNGYGTAVNIDSARYWLSKVAAKGDKRAIAELEEPEPENSFVKKVSSYKGNSATKVTITAEEKTFRKIEQHTPQDEMEGTYTGYIIRYDWSGKHVISKSELTLTLNRRDSLLSGEWEEKDGNFTTFQARLTDSALVFSNSTINRKDHYHPDKPVLFEFKDARLQLVKNADSVYLAGNLQLYSIEYREPEKPMYISLARKEEKQPAVPAKRMASTLSTSAFQDQALPASGIEEFMVYPNPFSGSFTVSFTLHQKASIQAVITDMGGRIVYRETWADQPAGQFSKNILVDVPVGSYVIRLNYNGQTQTSVLIKQ